jgi:hypothetical protein
MNKGSLSSFLVQNPTIALRDLIGIEFSLRSKLNMKGMAKHAAAGMKYDPYYYLEDQISDIWNHKAWYIEIYP